MDKITTKKARAAARIIVGYELNSLMALIEEDVFDEAFNIEEYKQGVLQNMIREMVETYGLTEHDPIIKRMLIAYMQERMPDKNRTKFIPTLIVPEIPGLNERFKLNKKDS